MGLRTAHVLALIVVAGCSGKHDDNFNDNNNGTDASANNSDTGPSTNPSDDSGCPFCGVDSGGDGSVAACSPNPLNYDIPGNGCDDDDDGIVDNPPACDTGLAATGTAAQFAQAIGLCAGTKPAVADATHWGVVAATYTQGYGSTTAPSASQHGILSQFGTSVNPRQGSSLGVLSSGYAADQDGCGTKTFKYGCPMTGAGSAPPGYPKAAGSCPIDSSVNDVSAVVLQIKVPANAKGFAYDFDFFSGEWPEWVCTNYNDSYVAWLTSMAFTGMSGDYNISFDSKNNPISVNNNFFQVCSPANATVGCAGSSSSTDSCSLGNAQLQGTGFFINGDNQCGATDSGGGATGWLTTQAPAQAGETMTIQFMIWDTGDQAYDSSVLIDNWNWQPAPVTVQTGRPPS
jgi:hypothetical protein